ncbi:MAG: DUF368 domain-containing protein [Halodesulfurarchaeum sp.]
MATRDWIVVYLKGFAMGTADAVPGVSGGTIALITGIYDRLIRAIAEIDGASVKQLLLAMGRGYSRTGRQAVIDRAREMDVPFLVVLVAGIVSAAVTAANVILVGITVYPGLTYAFFFGLIAASAFVLRDEVALDGPTDGGVAIAGFLLAYFLSGSVDGALGGGLGMTFVAGAIAICAMILPGISGSLILLTLGKYETIVSAVHDVTAGVFALDAGAVGEPFVVLLVFSLGALLGILSFARVVSWALERYRSETLTFLIALMVGALRAPAAKVVEAVATWSATVVGGLVVVAVLGAMLVLILDSMTAGVEY